MGHYWSEIDPEGAARQHDKLMARKKYVDKGWTTVRTGE